MDGFRPSAASQRDDEAFRRQAVEHWLRSGLTGTRNAREVGISYPTFNEWKRRYCSTVMPARADLETG